MTDQILDPGIVRATTGTRATVPLYAPLTLESLDLAIERIQHASARSAAALHTIGCELAAVHASSAWKLRVDPETGRNAYNSFGAWSKAELGIAHNRASDLIALAKAFTAEQIEQYGRSALIELTRLPTQQHPAMLEQLDHGASVRDVKASVAAEKRKLDFVRGDDAPNEDSAKTNRTKSKRTRNATKAAAEAKASATKLAEVIAIGSQRAKQAKQPDIADLTIGAPRTKSKAAAPASSDAMSQPAGSSQASHVARVVMRERPQRLKDINAQPEATDLATAPALAVVHVGGQDMLVQVEKDDRGRIVVTVQLRRPPGPPGGETIDGDGEEQPQQTTRQPRASKARTA